MNAAELLENNINESKQEEVLELSGNNKTNRKMYIESYGCQMNFSDSEIVASILTGEGFSTTKDITTADLVLVNLRNQAVQHVYDLTKYLHQMVLYNTYPSSLPTS